MVGPQLRVAFLSHPSRLSSGAISAPRCPLKCYELLSSWNGVLFYLFLLIYLLLAKPCGRWDLPLPGIEPRPPALGAQSLNHWTTREVLEWHF